MELVNACWDKSLKYYRNPFDVASSKIDARYRALSENMAIVRKGLGDNTVAVFDIASALKRIRDDKLYLDFPKKDFPDCYYDFFDFAKEQFGGKKSTIYNYIAIYDRFTADGKAKDEYKDYTYTQLVSMLSLTEEELPEIKPSWSVSRIKEYAKTCKSKQDSIVSNRLENDDVKEWTLTSDDMRKAFLDDFCNWRKEFESCVIGVTLRLFSVTLSAVYTLIAMQFGDDVSYYISDVENGIKSLPVKDVIALLKKEDVKGVVLDSKKD